MSEIEREEGLPDEGVENPQDESFDFLGGVTPACNLDDDCEACQ